MGSRVLRCAMAALVVACGGDDAQTPTPPESGTIGAPGVRIDAVAMYQGPERMLMVDGAAVDSSVPLIAGREALLRVFYTTDEGYDGREVSARLTLNGETLEEVTTLHEGSLPDALSSTVNFRLSADQVQGGDYAVALTQEGDPATDNAAARHPASGEEALPVMMQGQRIRVMLVPLSYEADGSGRLPDTSTEQLERYRQELYGLFPLAEIELMLHDPVAFSTPLTTGMSPALDFILQLRSSEAPDDDVYYHGLVNNAETLIESGDIGGLAATIDMKDDPTMRASVSTGFTGWQSAGVFVHELGHLHGRYHSPCGSVVGADPDYPHALGGVGVTGYDLTRDQLMPVADFFDLMGYCEPRFISDLNYSEVALHVQQVSGGMMASWHGAEKRTYERMSWHGDGSQHWLSPVERRPVPGLATRVWLTLDDGTKVAAIGQLSRFDHGAGGILHLERTAALGARAIVSVARQ